MTASSAWGRKSPSTRPKNTARPTTSSTTVLETSQDGICIIDCNQEALKFFQCFSGEEVRSKAMRILPEYQPDGLLSSATVAGLMRETFAGKTLHAEWIFDLPDEKAMSAAVTVAPISVDAPRG